MHQPKNWQNMNKVFYLRVFDGEVVVYFSDGSKLFMKDTLILKSVLTNVLVTQMSEGDSLLSACPSLCHEIVKGNISMTL